MWKLLEGTNGERHALEEIVAKTLLSLGSTNRMRKTHRGGDTGETLTGTQHKKVKTATQRERYEDYGGRRRKRGRRLAKERLSFSYLSLHKFMNFLNAYVKFKFIGQEPLKTERRLPTLRWNDFDAAEVSPVMLIFLKERDRIHKKLLHRRQTDFRDSWQTRIINGDSPRFL